MKKFLILITSTLMITMLTACGSSALVGKWTGGSGTLSSLEFFSDGTYKSSDANHQGSYSVDGNKIKLDGYLEPDLTYTFDLKGNKLTLYYENGGVRGEYNRSN